MQAIESKTFLEALHWRYATKKFDAARKIPAELWAALEASLVLTPSSYGLQPWKFLVVTDPALRKALVPHSWNQTQPSDCSHFVVFAVRDGMDEAHVDRFVARAASVRGVDPSVLQGYRNMMVSDVVKGPRGAQAAEWAARQAYIALGQFMAVAALAGVDTCPIEGLVPKEYDRILGLEGSGYHTVVACAAGYRAADDKYASAPKVRFEAAEVIERR